MTVIDSPAATSVVLDLQRPRARFPRIHEGRYEVDPVGSGIAPVAPRLVETARRAGIRFLRIGLGIWLPGPTFEPGKAVAEREWFHGSTLQDVADDSLYDWTHLDRNLDICVALGVEEVLFNVDYMPATLSARRKPPKLPRAIRHIAQGYSFPDGVRSSPPRDPEVFAAASLRAVRHVESRGLRIRAVELWNEPDLPLFYTGSFEEFWRMYAPFARVMREAGHRVGGPSWAHVLQPELWRDEFIARCAREQVPLDVYTWHRYPRSPQTVIDCARAIRELLDRNGLQATESVIDEWGYNLHEGEPGFWGSAAMAAFMATALVGLVDAGVAAQAGGLLCDPAPLPLDGERMLGLARRNGEPNPVFHCFAAYEDFQQTPMRIPVDGDPAGVLAGTDEESTRLGVIISNAEDTPRRVALSLRGAECDAELRLLTQQSFDRDGGFEPAVALRIGGDPVEVELPPRTMAVVGGALLGPDARQVVV
ncbi:MAG TPA: hypothetical protein VFC09_07390 [Candidatus Dormibacteraeota bacterium]|nr:hypothetical protein [Candidatus Dormibacteraeota bacterium]